jgi:citrate lyase subunit beta/citryl-CoA lyase
MTIRSRRSALYMPAANARAIEKARGLPCDVVILDLEDAVAPDAKALARAQASDAVAAGGFGGRERVIRVNGLDTEWGAEDLAAAAEVAPDAVLAPKVSSREDLRAYRAALGERTPLWIMVETCFAILRLEELAAASVEFGVDAWVVGSNDLAKEMRCRLDEGRGTLAPALTMAVVAARSRGLVILDGVYNDLEDDAGLGRQCAAGAAMGFDGKTLIHPRQVEIANRAFSPSPAEVEWSRAVVAAFETPENAAKGAIRLNGQMVERLHLDHARRTLASALG